MPTTSTSIPHKPFPPLLSNSSSNPQQLLLRSPRYFSVLNGTILPLNKFSKIIHRAKTLQSFHFQAYPGAKKPTKSFIRLIATGANRTCKKIKPGPYSPAIPLSYLKPFLNLQYIYLQGAKDLRRRFPNLDISEISIHLPLMIVSDSKMFTKNNDIPKKGFSKMRKLTDVAIQTLWTVDSMSNLRKLTQKISESPGLQRTALQVEEMGMHIYLHSFHNLGYFEKLHTFEAIVETWESFAGALDYTHKFSNLKRFKLATGKKFNENAMKKQHISLTIANKLGAFPDLEDMSLVFDFRGFIQQTIEFLGNISYPSSLKRLNLDLMLPDFDTLIQKATKSLSMVTYLSVENQPPFKDFIKSHEKLGNLKSFRFWIDTKQMQSSHSKLFRALTVHMKSLEEVELDIRTQQAKPFLYLGLYNTLHMREEVKKVKVNMKGSHVEFSGCDLLEIDNRLTGLKEIEIRCEGEKVGNEKVQGLFKSVALKGIEEISLDFVQAVRDAELEKRFIMLEKCERLRKLKLRFEVEGFSEISMEQIFKAVGKLRRLEEFDVELVNVEIEEEYVKRWKEIVRNKRRLGELFRLKGVGGNKGGKGGQDV